jgi:hypothetical protein
VPRSDIARVYRTTKRCCSARSRRRGLDHDESLVRITPQLANLRADAVKLLVRIRPQLVNFRADVSDLVPDVLQDLDRDIAAGHRHLPSV